MNKKQKQLGMNPSTASAKLLKDLLYDFIVKSGYVCYRCKNPMTRTDFSIEHIVPWLDSDCPIELFFNINNISYSHLSCNSRAARQNRHKPVCGTLSKYKTGCRCTICTAANAEYQRLNYSTDTRRLKYIREKIRV